MADNTGETPGNRSRIPGGLLKDRLETGARLNAGWVQHWPYAPLPETERKSRFTRAWMPKVIRSGFVHWLATEQEKGTAFNLAPFAVACGILLYFALPNEPDMAAVLAASTITLLVVVRQKFHRTRYYSFLGLALVGLGLSVAKIHSTINPVTTVHRQITAEISGTVLMVDRNSRGAVRYLLAPDRIAKLPQNALPLRVRISATAGHTPFTPGDYIKGIVRIAPISGPVFPGSYDFSFHAWFNRLGAAGFFLGAPQMGDGNQSLNWIENVQISIHGLRLKIDQRVLRAIPSESGRVAAALITGNRSLIPSRIQETLRFTGLAHILAISGLHMSLVTLTIMGSMRFLATLIPGAAELYPIKKWAAATAFTGATAYLVISGASVATQRAWIMISVMLIATLINRRAITMRTVAVAALLILITNPASVLSPGFQLSFAAVMALVAGYEALNRRKTYANGKSLPSGSISVIAETMNRPVKYLWGILLTSLMAGTATAFVSAWHFQHVAPLGLLANLLAMPLVGFLVMPFALFSVLLMPYGLESVALLPVEMAIEKIIAIANWVNAIPLDGNTGLLPPHSLFLFWVSLVFLTVPKTWLRAGCIIPMLIMALTWQIPAKPDLIVSENGRSIAVVDASSDSLHLAKSKQTSFAAIIWNKAWGLVPSADTALENACSKDLCKFVSANGTRVVIVYDPQLIKSSCSEADLLIAPRLWWVNCPDKKPDMIFRRHDFELNGTHAFYFNNGMIRVQPSLINSGRPWNRSVKHPDTVNDIAGSIRRDVPEP